MVQKKLIESEKNSDNELRLRQIDSEIERLNKLLVYLHRVRLKYLAIAEAERDSRGRAQVR